MTDQAQSDRDYNAALYQDRIERTLQRARTAVGLWLDAILEDPAFLAEMHLIRSDFDRTRLDYARKLNERHEVES